MKLLSRSKEEPEINLTSLIDVVLLLLVFFMVSTSFVREAEINIRLPEASADAAEIVEAEVLEIGITESGNFLVNGTQLVNNEPRTLRRAIEIVAGDRRDLKVIIRADARSVNQANVTAMSIIGELGFSSLNIATATTPDSQ
jgi:biopolymer transport protein ExbD